MYGNLDSYDVPDHVTAKLLTELSQAFHPMAAHGSSGWRTLLLLLAVARLASAARFHDFERHVHNQSHPTHWLTIGTDVNVTLDEGKWWHGHIWTFGLHAAPLRLVIRVQRASGCSEGANTDGSCVFGLKIFGAVGDSSGALTAIPGSEEQRHGSGETYELHVGACALQGEASRLFVGVWGWDGTSEFVLRATQGMHTARYHDPGRLRNTLARGPPYLHPRRLAHCAYHPRLRSRVFPGGGFLSGAPAY